MNDLSLRQKFFLGIIIIFSSFQILGFLFNWKELKGIGAASLISPFPKVFGDVDGLETFASKFTLILHHNDGRVSRIEVTPELYSKLKGPYNRRNVYGAALSYAPKMPENLWKTVFHYGFTGPLIHELDLPEDLKCVGVEIATKTKGRSDIWVMEEIPCQ